jgi:hypothetical protein
VNDFELGFGFGPSYRHCCNNRSPRSRCLALLALLSLHAQVCPAVPCFTARDHLMQCSHPWVLQLEFPCTYRLASTLCCCCCDLHPTASECAPCSVPCARNVSTGRPRVIGRCKILEVPPRRNQFLCSLL